MAYYDTIRCSLSLHAGSQAAILFLLFMNTMPAIYAQHKQQAIQAGYVRGIGGASWYNTPQEITDAVDAMGYGETVQADLRVMADLWRYYVNSDIFFVEYHIPLKPRFLEFTMGGLLRSERAKRYAEVSYNPSYIFSGTEMTSRGGGLYAGLAYVPSFGKWNIFISASAGYFNFSRDFLHYFYLDPQLVGYPIERYTRTREFSSTIGGWMSGGFSYSWKRYSFSPLATLLCTGTDEASFGDIGLGAALRIRLGDTPE